MLYLPVRTACSRVAPSHAPSQAPARSLAATPRPLPAYGTLTLPGAHPTTAPTAPTRCACLVRALHLTLTRTLGGSLGTPEAQGGLPRARSHDSHTRGLPLDAFPRGTRTCAAHARAPGALHVLLGAGARLSG